MKPFHRLLAFLWDWGFLVVGLYYLSHWALTNSSRNWTFAIGIIVGMWLATAIDRLVRHLIRRGSGRPPTPGR